MYRLCPQSPRCRGNGAEIFDQIPASPLTNEILSPVSEEDAVPSPTEVAPSPFEEPEIAEPEEKVSKATSPEDAVPSPTEAALSPFEEPKEAEPEEKVSKATSQTHNMLDEFIEEKVSKATSQKLNAFFVLFLFHFIFCFVLSSMQSEAFFSISILCFYLQKIRKP